MADERSVKIPEHTILSRLGRGGMASVYLARHDRLGRLVAVKVIDDRFEADEHFRQRFEREARTAAGLTHPNIVPVHEYGFTDEGRPFLTMAFLEGGSLRERLQKRGPMPVDDALAITRQIAAALLVAHNRNIVHRDLKPDNVLFQGDTALLTDFGIAKVLDASTALTGMGTNPGTVKYFSPEQAKEQPIDQRSDIYTLGVVLYEMLTGHIPIEGETVMQLILGIAQKQPDPLPPPLRGLQPFLDVMLAKDPMDRVASCADVIAIIQAMERNWLRYGEVDRLTDGVMLTTSSGRTAAAAPAAAVTPAFAPAAAPAPTPAAAPAPPPAAANATTRATPAPSPTAGHVDTDAATLLATGPGTAGAHFTDDAPLHDGQTLPMQAAARPAPTRDIYDEPLNDGQTVPMQRAAPPEHTPPPPPPAPTMPPPHAASGDTGGLTLAAPGAATTAPAARPAPLVDAGPPAAPAPADPRAPASAAASGSVIKPGASQRGLLVGGVAAVLLAGVAFAFFGGGGTAPSAEVAVATDATSAGLPAPDPVEPVPAPEAQAPTATAAAAPSVTLPPTPVAATPAPVEAVPAQPKAEPPPPANDTAQARDAARPAKAEAAARPSEPAPETQRGSIPPRDFLVGTWDFQGTEMGERVHVIWRADASGRVRYLMNPGEKNVQALEGKWSYDNGTLLEALPNGNAARSEVRMISRNEFELRILDNGDSRYRNVKRRYRRTE